VTTTSHHTSHVLVGSAVSYVNAAAETQAEMQMPDPLNPAQHLNDPIAESRLHCMTQAVLGKLQLLKLSMQVEARAEVEVPEHLISAEHLDQLMAEHQPRFLPTATSISKEDIPVIPSDEPSEQIMQFKLSNGIKVNARRTLNEPKAAMLRMIAAGDTPRPPSGYPTLSACSTHHES